MALGASIAATGLVAAAMLLADRSGAAVPVTTRPAAGTAVGDGAASADTTMATGAAFRDGTYAGDVATMRWGDVQVQVTIADGKVASVTTLQSPTDRKSTGINARAQPILEQEAVAAQSADIDVVSGATYTSQSYAASLQSALDRAAAQPSTTTAAAP